MNPHHDPARRHPTEPQSGSKPTEPTPPSPRRAAHGDDDFHNPHLDRFYLEAPPPREERGLGAFGNDDDYQREHELLLDDIASEREDFARSEEEGWYYSDDD